MAEFCRKVYFLRVLKKCSKNRISESWNLRRRWKNVEVIQLLLKQFFSKMYALITQSRENQIFCFWSQNFRIDFPCRIWSLNVSFYSWFDCFIKFCKPMIFKSHFCLQKFRTQKVEKIHQILTVCTAGTLSYGNFILKIKNTFQIFGYIMHFW